MRLALAMTVPLLAAALIAAETARFPDAVPDSPRTWTTPARTAAPSRRAAPPANEDRPRADVPPADPTLAISGRVAGPDGRGAGGVRIFCRPEPDLQGLREAAERGGRPDGGPILRTGKGRRARERSPDARQRARSRGILIATTDARGRFRFLRIREGERYSVGVATVRPLPGGTCENVEPGRSDVELRVPERSEVLVTVREEASGRPVAGCRIRVLDEAVAARTGWVLPLGLGGSAGEPTTGADGTVRLPGLFPGEVRLLLLRPGYEVTQRTVRVGGDAPRAIRAGLVPAASIRGRVLDAEGVPVPGARVEVTVPAPLPSPGRSGWSGALATVTAQDGRFAITGLPAATELHVAARGPGGGWFRETVRLRTREEREVECTLAAPAALVVSVRPRGTGALAGHPVRVRGIDDAGLDLSGETDENGLAGFRDLPPGRYRIRAGEAAGRDADGRELELGSGQAVRIEVVVPAMTRLAGRVLDDDRPVAVAKVGFGPVGDTPDSGRPLMFDVRNGCFEGRLRPGVYHVHVSLPGRRRELPGTVVVPAAARHDLEIRLADG